MSRFDCPRRSALVAARARTRPASPAGATAPVPILEARKGGYAAWVETLVHRAYPFAALHRRQYLVVPGRWNRGCPRSSCYADRALDWRIGRG